MERLRRYWRRHRFGRDSWRSADKSPEFEEVPDPEGTDDHDEQAGIPDRPEWNRPAWHWWEGRLLEGELVADCEAFLLGHYAERLDQESSSVPVWAWTNLLAHGSEEEVRRAATGRSLGPVRTRGWRAARAYLATELLTAVDRGSSLEDLQHHVLAPLELRLSTRREAPSWDPQRWVVIVRSALQDYQHSHRI